LIEAQRLNGMSGGAVIAPWDIEPGHDLEEWLEASELFQNLPNIRNRIQAQDNYLNQWRRSHKDYARIHGLL
jgi:hypothetical protein